MPASSAVRHRPAAGFEIAQIDEFCQARPKFACADSLGVAISPA